MENWEKKARSEAQRLQSIQDRIALEKKKKEVIRISLHDVDNQENTNRRTVFNDSDSDDNAEILPSTSNRDPEDEESTEKPAKSSNKIQLFDDDEEQEMGDIVFENKHKGKKGEKLMNMEARFLSDDRFKMGNNFLSESEESEDEMQVEKRKNRDLLSKVLGKVVLPQQKTVNVVDTRESIPHRPFTRFDPTNAEHVAWVKQYGSKKAEKKPSKKIPVTKEKDDEEKDEERKNRDPNVDRTTEEKFFEVNSQFSEELKAKLQNEQSDDKPNENFSFLAMVGRAVPESESSEPFKVVADSTLTLPTPKVKALTLTKGGSNFFISSQDLKVTSVISNFRRTQSEDKTLAGWTNYRNSIMKIYHHQRKLALKGKQKDQIANRKRKADEKENKVLENK